MFPEGRFWSVGGNKVNGNRVCNGTHWGIYTGRDLSETLLVTINLNALFNILNLHIFMQTFKSVNKNVPEGWVSGTRRTPRRRTVCHLNLSVNLGVSPPLPKKQKYIYIVVCSEAQREHLDIQSVSEPTVCPHPEGPPPPHPLRQDKNHVLYCTACFQSPLIIDTSMWTLLNLRIVFYSLVCVIYVAEEDSRSCRRWNPLPLECISSVPLKGQCDDVEHSVESVEIRSPRGLLRPVATEAALTTSLYNYVTL